MSKQMLIDAAHPEELRVVVMDDDKIDEFEVETAGKEQVKGNVYVAEIARVEPSLQAAFVNYGGNRNGFLAFTEIHPQWFDLPKKEKDALIQELEDIAARRRAADEKEDAEVPESAASVDEEMKEAAGSLSPEEMEEDARALAKANSLTPEDQLPEEDANGKRRPQRHARNGEEAPAEDDSKTNGKRLPPIHRRYNIQDVVKEGHKVLVQVNKEERGTKGAALSTYISLAGRYTVLMPNTPYAGGISRKITEYGERKQLQQTLKKLDMPKNMGLIVRTAGVSQDIEHLQRDVSSLVNCWESITKQVDAIKPPQCVHEDGSLVTRAVRDMFTDDISEIIISGRRAYQSVKDYIKSLMPESVKVVKEHRAQAPIFTHHHVEHELNKLFRTRVELPSGGYLIINPTEALVSVDVNSGRATQERNIEETALKTNLEAADEVARQLRLRDLAGLVVIDFIDMEDRRNERAVERAMRKASRRDRARIQIGPITPFGLMEMSRQRLRPSLRESTFVICDHCNGSGTVASLASSALMILRSLEEDSVRSKADRVIISTSPDLAIYLLNHKRDLIRDMEARYKFQILIRSDDKYLGPDHRLELIRLDATGASKSHTQEVILREPAESDEPRTRRRRRGGRRIRGSEDAASGAKYDTNGATDKTEDKKAANGSAPARHGKDDKAEDRDSEENGGTGRRGRRTRGGRRRGGRSAETQDAPQGQTEAGAKTADKSDAKADDKKDDTRSNSRGGARRGGVRRPRRVGAADAAPAAEESKAAPSGNEHKPEAKKPASTSKQPAAQDSPKPAKPAASKVETPAKASQAEDKKAAAARRRKPVQKETDKNTTAVTVERIGADTQAENSGKGKDQNSGGVFQRWWGRSG